MFKTVLTKLLCLSLLNFVACQVATNFTEGTNVPNVCLCATSGQCDRAGGEFFKMKNAGCSDIDVILLNRWWRK
jgi:hypothetical protein